MTAVSASISTQSGSLSLTSGPYAIIQSEDGSTSGFDIGQVTKSRVWATSPYVAGGVEVLSVPGIVTATLKMYVIDDDPAALQSDLDTLIAAFSQYTYTLTWVVGDATYAWQCWDAEYAIDPWPVESLVPETPQLPVTFTFPRSPIPVSGPI